ncbi:MAG: hypothetical protein A2X25_10785 [Chloroflexi bacterium GWB2_49_20]|nr:MAG: hypothetical protein A2X25_10785 [Chloroflexi bacterium GWB2_49_20]OGN78957.1 MAG: hypothetical protein A2X26_00570 [Chloroflexi bacterium GWC2_49_37]OGN86282.1 MAG: hypothetical protein A2X27_05210 [Chloroflexi bacterium GWD2_49_16]HBG74510.1 hypothetical protein [Anaerolineae bacterium]
MNSQTGNFFIRSNRESRPQKGQSLVELALTITILLTLLAGAFDLGSAFLDYIALRDAAQEGAMYGSIDPKNTDSIVERVQNSSDTPVDFSTFVLDCSPFLQDSPDSICVNFPGETCTGNEITVTVRYHYNLTMPLIGTIIGSQTIPLHASVTNVILTEACE